VPDFYADPVSEQLAKVGPGGYEHGWHFVGVPGSAAHMQAVSDLSGRISGQSPEASHALDKATEALSTGNFQDARLHMRNAATNLMADHGSYDDVTAIHDAARQLTYLPDSPRGIAHSPAKFPLGGGEAPSASAFTQMAGDYRPAVTNPRAEWGAALWQPATEDAYTGVPQWNQVTSEQLRSGAALPARKHEHQLHSDPVIDRLTEVLSKVGPKGYKHGWIYVGTGTGGSADHPDLGHGTVTRAGSKDVHVRFGSGEEADFARRDARPGESEGLKRTGLSSQYTSTGKPAAGDVDQLIANYRTMHGKDPSAAQIAQLRRKASRG
jgi:hypothetical protein